MSYAVAAALQTAVHDRLVGDGALTGLVGSAVFDAPPPGPVPDLYVSFGAEEVRDLSSGDGAGARHDFTISVVGSAAGFLPVKAAAGAVCDALIDAELPLARGRLVALRFDRARARRVAQGAKRRIDLRFRAHVEDD